MTEILLTLIILVLLGYIAYIQHISIQEREKLLKLFKAKDLRELTANEVLDKMPKQEERVTSDVVPADEIIEDEVLFDKHIAAVQAQAKEEFELANDNGTV